MRFTTAPSGSVSIKHGYVSRCDCENLPVFSCCVKDALKLTLLHTWTPVSFLNAAVGHWEANMRLCLKNVTNSSFPSWKNRQPQFILDSNYLACEKLDTVVDQDVHTPILRHPWYYKEPAETGKQMETHAFILQISTFRHIFWNLLIDHLQYLHISLSSFLMLWLGLGTGTSWLEFGKDHVLA